ncbi:CNNM domain-containing protein [Mumia zhuanghuii]|uniref:HlyC/CorC family transporter n=1 Tax=Mumia zhuanghuii TaxID=2585211 RepID=A0A5C4MKP8_9ACTN|nr:hemolysin family protein [Mumia zhuanghuii]TNC42837.1 HlyC/CorC family transporter [Mumia zhuanghuii]TNC46054.1 HlyC/CorC family transporter [Mumia zhuanghuii]
MTNPWVVVAATVVVIALSAFFVAVEFALLAAKRHRLEDAAATSRSARAALRSAGELTVVLAGSQLGITACTLALGAITKPAVHHALAPLLESWGMPLWTADVGSFVLALIIVTFLHLVIGEMAPKSWAIAHPERSAIVLAIPMRAFMTVFRPALLGLNALANRCVRAVGVEPVDEAASGQNPRALRQLLEHSANVGALDASYSAQLSSALDLESATLGDLVRERVTPTAVPTDATVTDVQEASRRTGHLRVLVGDGADLHSVVHVRDTLDLVGDAAVADVTRPVFALRASTPLSVALAAMRETRNHLVVVTASDGRTVGVVTLADVLRTLFPVGVTA